MCIHRHTKRTKVLHDLGHVKDPEPFQRLVHQVRVRELRERWKAFSAVAIARAIRVGSESSC